LQFCWNVIIFIGKNSHPSFVKKNFTSELSQGNVSMRTGLSQREEDTGQSQREVSSPTGLSQREVFSPTGLSQREVSSPTGASQRVENTGLSQR